MPAKSEKQRRFFGAVRSVQEGKQAAKGVSSSVRKAARTISRSAVKDFTKKSKK